MDNPPIIPGSPQRKDDDQIKLLAVFHFILAGLALFGIGFLGLHYFIMHSVFANPQLWKNNPGGGPPPEFFAIFVWFYVAGGVLLGLVSVLKVLSGVFLRQRKHRMFSQVVAGLDCVQIPFGTALGVCTMMVLFRETVRQSYEE